MGHGYKAVQWNPFKVWYDVGLVVAALAVIAAFVGTAIAAAPDGGTWSEIQLAIKATGATAFALLHLVLAIGPLARLSPRFKPFLYNRRHLGVATFLIALAHAALVILWYHGFAALNPFVSLFASNPRYASINGFPFESLGVGALAILFVMAATSHDFWNANLGPRLWKAIHMGVYPAYALLFAHVMLGAVQGEKGLGYAILAGGGASLLALLHLGAGLVETGRDRRRAARVEDGWLKVGSALDIPDGRAVITLAPGGERIAVFRHRNAVFAISNVCRHQAGPLGEGCIKDGLVVCPWHGFQYRPEDGVSPPPFTERVPTYRVKLLGDVVYVDPKPRALGEPNPPVPIASALTEAAE